MGHRGGALDEVNDRARRRRRDSGGASVCRCDDGSPMTTLEHLTPRQRQILNAAFFESWEATSSIFVLLFSLRFLGWRLVDDGTHSSSPFGQGLFRVMESIIPVPELWGVLMVVSIPAALFAIAVDGQFRLWHRLWLVVWWGMFAGANAPIGVGNTIETFGVLLLWGFPVVAVIQFIVLADRMIGERYGR